MSHVPYFWQGLGFTVAIAMFAGAYIYDGNIEQMRKGLVSVLMYGTMILWKAVSQIVDARLNHPEIITPSIKPTTYVVALDVVVTTVAWLIGIAIGSFIIHRHKGVHHDA